MVEQVARRPPLPNLTSLRFFAAAYVLLYHTRGGKWFGLGYTGVTLFFVLSGFILAYNYPVVPPGQRKRFYLARFARIYPLYFVSCFAMFPWFIPYGAVGHVGRAVLSTFLYLALLQTWVPPLSMTINAAGWTLSVEALFYAIFPFIIGPMGFFARRWISSIAVFYATLLIPTLAAYLIWLPRHPDQALLFNSILSIPIFYMGTFLIGMILALRFLEHRPVFNGWTALAATLFCLGCLAAASRIPSVEARIVQDGMLALPYGILIYICAGWKSKILGNDILQLGGEISYSIYLFTWVFSDAVQRLFHHSRGMLPLRFALFLGLNYLAYQFIEKPSRNWLLHVFGIKSHPKPIETPDPALP